MKEALGRLLAPAAGPVGGVLPVVLAFASVALVAFFGALAVLSWLVAGGWIRPPGCASGTLVLLTGLALVSVAFAALMALLVARH